MIVWHCQMGPKQRTVEIPSVGRNFCIYSNQNKHANTIWSIDWKTVETQWPKDRPTDCDTLATKLSDTHTHTHTMQTTVNNHSSIAPSLSSSRNPCEESDGVKQKITVHCYMYLIAVVRNDLPRSIPAHYGTYSNKSKSLLYYNHQICSFYLHTF